MELHFVRPRSIGYVYICLCITIEFKTFEGHSQKSPRYFEINLRCACKAQLVATLSVENSSSVFMCYQEILLLHLSPNVQRTYTCWCNKNVIVWLYVFTGDNPLKLVDYLLVHTHEIYNKLHV